MQRWIIICLLAILLSGCGSTKERKVQDLEFTVAADQEVPAELREGIESRKEKPFELTYSLGNDLYIVKGYGQQPTGGYSIRVPEFYLTESSIVAKIQLVGPGSKEEITQIPTYPYIVLKTEFREEPVKIQ